MKFAFGFWLVVVTCGTTAMAVLARPPDVPIASGPVLQSPGTSSASSPASDPSSATSTLLGFPTSSSVAFTSIASTEDVSKTSSSTLTTSSSAASISSEAPTSAPVFTSSAASSASTLTSTLSSSLHTSSVLSTSSDVASSSVVPSSVPSLSVPSSSVPSVTSGVPPISSSSGVPSVTSSSVLPTIPSTTSSDISSTPSSISSSAAPQSTQVNKQAYLDEHNTWRTLFGSSDLQWSDDLAAKAQGYAERCELKHSDGALGPVGENLAAATGSFTAVNAVKLFAQDHTSFSLTRRNLNHFTQVIWKSTTRLGCGAATCGNLFPGHGDATYHVCLYDPVGNVVGEERANLP